MFIEAKCTNPFVSIILFPSAHSLFEKYPTYLRFFDLTPPDNKRLHAYAIYQFRFFADLIEQGLANTDMFKRKMSEYVNVHREYGMTLENIQVLKYDIFITFLYILKEYLFTEYYGRVQKVFPNGAEYSNVPNVGVGFGYILRFSCKGLRALLILINIFKMNKNRLRKCHLWFGLPNVKCAE